MDDMEMVQMAVSTAITKEAMDFQASMSAAVINGSFEKAAEMQANFSRSAGLAAQGIGANLDAVV